MKTQYSRNSIDRSLLRSGLLLIALALGCFALLPAPNAFGVVPAPDGGYPNFTTAEGTNALKNLTTGAGNTAAGWYSLFANSTASFNTALGAGTLALNNADSNTAIGAAVLLSNTTGEENTATGAFALLNHTNGVRNTANGFRALVEDTEGNRNTAIGAFALQNNSTGSRNIALGIAAGAQVTTANDVICIGADGENVSNSCYIGQIFGATVSTAVPVIVNQGGHLGTVSSSRRFKNEIKPMDQTSEAILALNPVTFHYKSDSEGTPQFGLIAEEVAKINPDLVVRDAGGEIYTVRYEAVNAMLLNEFLKEHRKVEQQGRKIQEQEGSIGQLKSTVAQQQKESQSIAAQQQKEIQTLTATLKKQAFQIQKVSAQLAAASPSRGGLEVTMAAPQTVRNNQ